MTHQQIQIEKLFELPCNVILSIIEYANNMEDKNKEKAPLLKIAKQCVKPELKTICLIREPLYATLLNFFRSKDKDIFNKLVSTRNDYKFRGYTLDQLLTNQNDMNFRYLIELFTLSWQVDSYYHFINYDLESLNIKDMYKPIP